MSLSSILPKFPQPCGNCHIVQKHHSSTINHQATAMCEEQCKGWWNLLAVAVCLFPLISCSPWHARQFYLNYNLTELGTDDMVTIWSLKNCNIMTEEDSQREKGPATKSPVALYEAVTLPGLLQGHHNYLWTFFNSLPQCDKHKILTK